MAVTLHQTPSGASAQPISPVAATGQLSQWPPGFDPEYVINAHEASLADYLNRPVQDILARLGLGPIASPGAPDAEMPPGAAHPIDPAQTIQPVTDALGTLGTGQFNNADPTQLFQGNARAFESAAEPLGQALSGLGSVWQGSAASTAGDTTRAALADGAEVARQSTSLGESLSTVTASIQQAQAGLIAIINEFWTRIAAIGPNIIFPWGIAAAIPAASEAITETTEVMTETQGSLSLQAARVAAVGALVAMTAAPGLGAQPFAPLMQMATGLASPVMEGVSAATQAAQAGATGVAGSGASGAAAAGGAGTGAPDNAALSTATGGPGGPVGRGVPGGALEPRLGRPLSPRSQSVPALSDDVGGEPHAGAAKTSVGMGAGPMATGGPMASAGKAGVDGRHNAASFLHTSNDQIVGDLAALLRP